MTRPHLVLSSTLALAVAACAPSDGAEDQGGRGLPGGYELAVAQVSSEKSAQAVIDLNADELRLAIESGTLRLIDVRTDDEVAGGMIPGAQHIQLDYFDPADLGPRDLQEVVIYCRSGRRSATAAERLSAFTGEPARHLSGGILSWQESGGHVEVP